MKVIAHLSEPIDRFWLEDNGALRQFLDQELRYGLAKALDARVVNVITTEATPGSGTVDLAGVRSAITDLQELDLVPSGIVMTPSDWEDVEAEATTTFAANDNFPAATEALAQRLYGVPVAVSNSITSGSAIVGAFRDSARIFRTGSASITLHDSQPRDVSGTDYADYVLNQLVMRAEMRAEVAVTRPAGFILLGGS